ncbi:MAG: Gfo/Idh/MocA family oxidoreductase, partial [Clostridia bacterium]|nr:Gfo/Idh/MocA family oxidoreductase [Clostridia bacterium]
MFKVCVIGCGGIAQVHGAALTNMENVTLAACCDIVPEKAQAYAEKFHCTPYTDYETLLDKEQPDAVHLCTPHYLHTPMAEAAAERGIHVFTEKPPVISWDEWERLQKAGEKVRIGVCVQNRYNPNNE